MRISDWSSDVCSSDLHWARFAYATFMGNLQIGRDTPDLMPADAESSEYVKLMIKTLIPRSASMAVAEEHSSFSAEPDSSHATGDRKSVVQGQRVYERGDRGGSRLIKNKNTKTL